MNLSVLTPHLAGTVPPRVARFWGRVQQGAPDECWPWTGLRRRTGYGRTYVNRKDTNAHRAAYIFTFGEISSDDFVCHSCDNPPCCNPAHLFVGSAADNNRDKMQKDRVEFGSERYNAKLNDVAVRVIRLMRDKGLAGARDIASAYKIDRTLVYRIHRRTAWRRVQETA